MNPAIWYLTVELLSGAIAPTPISPALIGPVTEEQCEQVKASIKELPSVVAARCRKMVAMFACGVDGRPGTYQACPVLDDGTFVPVGK